MLKYSLTTLGCKVNQYESSAIAHVLHEAGLQPADPRRDTPDLVVVNSCCITRTAMQKSRQAIRKSLRAAPHAVVAVLGCYSDYDAAAIGRLLDSFGVHPERALVLGHHGEDLSECLRRIAGTLMQRAVPGTSSHEPNSSAGLGGNDVLMKAACSRCSAGSNTSIKAERLDAIKKKLASTRGLPRIRRFGEHQRAFVKVQDGCDAFCAYCVVPYTRSVLWSRGVDEVLSECRQLVQAGHKEIVLTGVFLGAYGRDTAIRRRWASGPAPLIDLVRRVAEIDGLWRLRLSSLEPADVTDDLLDLWREAPKPAPHFHLPLQSGSARVLKAMNRQYDPQQFLSTVERIRDALDRPAISTDIIAGFPDETDEDFEATLSVARAAGFSRIHAFPFSAIEGTAAHARRREAPNASAVRRRLGALRQVEQQTAERYRDRFIGDELEGLVERARPSRGPIRQAMTDRYLTIDFRPPRGEDWTGRVMRFEITGRTERGLAGRVCTDCAPVDAVVRAETHQ